MIMEAAGNAIKVTVTWLFQACFVSQRKMDSACVWFTALWEEITHTLHPAGLSYCGPVILEEFLFLF